MVSNEVGSPTAVVLRPATSNLKLAANTPGKNVRIAAAVRWSLDGRSTKRDDFLYNFKAPASPARAAPLCGFAARGAAPTRSAYLTDECQNDDADQDQLDGHHRTRPLRPPFSGRRHRIKGASGVATRWSTLHP